LSKDQKLRIIAKKILRNFWEGHFESEQQLKAWYQEASKANWTNPAKIKKEFPSASFLAGNRVVFNIKGNYYRLIVKISYDYQMVWIKFMGTHAEYDKIDTKQFKNEYQAHKNKERFRRGLAEAGSNI